jgi:enoyl-CoA hydratase
MDSGLQWEILNNEGVGPDMQARIGAFMGKQKT